MIRIDGFAIDVSTSEDHVYDSEVTRFPVEEGPDYTDNVRAKPIEVTLEGIVSDSPIGPVADERGGSVPTVVFRMRMEEIRQAREPITVETSKGVFRNMVLEQFSIPGEAIEGLRFKARFVQLQIATTQRTTVTIPRAKRRVNRGRAQVTNPDAEGFEAPSNPAAMALYGDVDTFNAWTEGDTSGISDEPTGSGLASTIRGRG